jgi:hypothetical protein
VLELCSKFFDIIPVTFIPLTMFMPEYQLLPIRLPISQPPLDGVHRLMLINRKYFLDANLFLNVVVAQHFNVAP